jgi:hypothetical protein
MTGDQQAESSIHKQLREICEQLARPVTYGLEMGKWNQDEVKRLLEHRRTLYSRAYSLALCAIHEGHNHDTIVTEALRLLGIEAELPRF